MSSLWSVEFDVNADAMTMAAVGVMAL